MVDPILSVFEQAGLMVLTLSFGAMVTASIWDQLNFTNGSIIFDGHEFEVDEQQIFLSYKYITTPRDESFKSIGPAKIEDEALVAYAASFKLLLHDKFDLIEAEQPEVQQRFHSYLENAILKKRGVIFLGALFLALLISFLIFSFYNTENSRLSAVVGAKTSSADQTDLLKRNITDKERLLKQLNWNGGYNYGFLANELVASSPKQLHLTEMNFNDYKTETEKQQRKPSIAIAGITDDLSAENNWIFLLKEKKWVKTVKLVKYQQDAGMDHHQFNLIITY